MVDLPFWQQLLLSVTQGLVAAGVVVLAGAWYFRNQERVRQEEANRGVLLGLRQSAIVEAVTALGELADAKDHDALNDILYDDDSSEMRASKQRVEDTWRAASRLLLAKQLLLPSELRTAFHDAIADVFSGRGEKAISDALLKLEDSLAPYLPGLPRASVAPGRPRAKAAPGGAEGAGGSAR